LTPAPDAVRHGWASPQSHQQDEVGSTYDSREQGLAMASNLSDPPAIVGANQQSYGTKLERLVRSRRDHAAANWSVEDRTVSGTPPPSDPLRMLGKGVVDNG
jgi:hypothetical protein